MEQANEIATFVIERLEYIIKNGDPEDGMTFEYSGADKTEAAELAMDYTLVATEYRDILKDDHKELYTETLAIVAGEYQKKWM